MNIRDVYLEQAGYCADLGSDFTAMLLRLIPDILPACGPVGEKILTWPGDPRSFADSVPLRSVAGLHALVLTDRDPALKALYPPAACPDLATLATTVTAAMNTHQAFLLNWLQSPPQTNESARSAPLVAAGGILMQRYGLPLRLLELGCSAGLNLRWDKVALNIGGQLFGPAEAPLILSPDWSGPLPETRDLPIASRKGVDLNPLDPADETAQLRLMAYIWPDQPDRLARMQTALSLAHALPATISKGDAIDWLTDELEAPRPGVTSVVFHTIAWQYFPADVQARGKALIKAKGSTATKDAPLSWLSMEADGNSPGAAVTLRLWPGDITLDLGRSDFHGRWVQWNETANAQ